MARTNSMQLPDYDELREILKHEAVRSIPDEKRNAHYVDFATILELLLAYRLPTSFF